MPHLKAWSSRQSRSANRLANLLMAEGAPLRLAASELRHHLEPVVDHCGPQARPAVAIQTGADVQLAAPAWPPLERHWGQRASLKSSRWGARAAGTTVRLIAR